ncbi:arginine deiminase family protein [Bacillus solimangrovi]|uniref:Arginine deiminase n=1 Tax=Bacillus solimangrovi TaxID=1305675 RepID=A0A1E5LK37_9BACI|nr:arginine deiminase family protein [Bacillus solimangrovi]OEH94450.1 arginine deiminase [Bacillus solimangrovi]
MRINPNCWDEFSELKTVIVCSPSKIDIPDKQTAEYMQWKKPVKMKKAQQDFDNMVNALEKEGVNVIDYSKYLPEHDLSFHNKLINRVYVRDLVCVFGNIVLPGEAGTSMRKPEYVLSHQLFQTWLDEETFPVQVNNSLTALEYGDVMILNNDAVLLNTGVRTSIDSVFELKDSIFKAGFSEIGVIDLPRRSDTLHIDMNGNVAGKDLFIAKSYMKFLPIQVLTEKASTYQMANEFLNRHGFDIEWTTEITHTLADINFLNINSETILISKKANQNIFKHHPKLQKKRFIEIDVNELEKGGGGIRCMTLPIERGNYS